MNGTLLEDIHEELSTVYENLKAEVLVAEIQENSAAGNSDFVISNKGTFSRAYRRDIIDVDAMLHEDKLTLNLSRNSLYDVLPEGLFHAPHVNKEGDSYTNRRKVVKQEEQDARLFFAPIESEFFYQRLHLEQHERAMLDDFYNLKDDFLINFWNLDTDIPQEYMVKLMKVLPYCHKITGDLELTRLCLAKILGQPVSFKSTYRDKASTEIDTARAESTEGFQLGVNSILDGYSYEVYTPVLEVSIGPVAQKIAGRYLEKNGVSKFIETFYDYFLPMELETKTIVTAKKEVGFVLDDALHPMMGISTYL